MANPYAIDSIGYNPYFMAAYTSPNANYMLAPTASTPQTASTAAVTTTQPQTPAIVAAKPEEEKSGSKAKLILGTVAVAGAALLCRKAFKAGSGNGIIEKITSGFKSFFEKGKSVKDKILKSEKFSVTKAGNETVCTIPGQKNIIKTGDIAAQAERLGIQTNTALLADKEAKILSYTIKDGGNIISVRGNKIVGYKNAAGESLDIKKLTAPVEAGDIAYSKTINEIITKASQKDPATLTKLENIFYTHSANGTTQRFVANAADNSKNGLRGVITNRFEIGSDTVKQYRLHNKQVDDALNGFIEGKVNNLKIAEAQYNVAGLGNFKIENGQISGITVGDKYFAKGSKEFDALLYDNKTSFENVLKNQDKYTNIVYQMA